MKRLLAILITCVLVGSLTACGNAGGSTENISSSAPSEETGNADGSDSEGTCDPGK